MRTALVLITAAAALYAVPADADQIRRTCRTDINGTRTCTTVTVRTSTDRIMGMPARTYVNGVRRGRCMPSPSGFCGGG